MKNVMGILLGIFMLNGCNVQSEAAALSGRSFILNNAENNAVISLAFDSVENRYYGKIVNNYFGMYEVSGQHIKFGEPASTMMMGPIPLMDAESHYLQTLEKVDSFVLEGTTLKLHTPDGTMLVFSEGTSPEEN